ncbi:MAG TPA: ABC transporter permease [Actinomycetota bacterium]|nr:ABC transporter permease [Actinomycetota bacterium]
MTPAFFRWDWILDHTEEVYLALGEHFYLTLLSVGVGFLISFPVAVFSWRHRRVYGPITLAAGVMYTIPSLALFALLIPFSGAFSTTTAVIPLIIYTLLILIRNIVAGLDSVDEDVRDAARGMGYSRRQLLWKVELPLALPAVVAGVRIATVTTIGLVTVTAVLGRGGFGYFILLGLTRTFPTAIILGAVASMLLAMGADFVLLRVERWLAPWARSRSVRTTG